jgi:hypothetical protein
MLRPNRSIDNLGKKEISYSVVVEDKCDVLEFVTFDQDTIREEKPASQRITRPSRVPQNSNAIPQVFEKMPKPDPVDFYKQKRNRYKWIPLRLVGTVKTTGASDVCIGNWEGIKKLDDWLAHYVFTSLESWTLLDWGGVSEVLINSCIDLGVKAIRKRGIKVIFASFSASSSRTYYVRSIWLS